MLSKGIHKSRFNLFGIMIFLAVFFAALAGFISIHETSHYFSSAPFHYDSAGYLYLALQTYDLVRVKGVVAAFFQVIKEKDSLDLILRILFAPQSLKIVFGHMTVLLPFMGLFIFLVIHYIFKKTQSWLISIAVLTFLFCSPFIYNPYLGIADYWKESIAIWILGCMILSWLLSEMMTKPFWSVLSGVFLGLLMMERTALAIFAVLMFIPIFSLTAIQRLRQDNRSTALIRLFAFLIPCGILSGMVALLQWEYLYNYYIVKGYAYASPTYLATLYYQNAREQIGFLYVILPIIYIICGFLLKWRQQYRDLLTVLWLLMSFPVIVVTSHAGYFGIYNVCILLLFLLLVTLIPNKLPIKINRIFSIMLILVGIFFSFQQYSATKIGSQAFYARMSPWYLFFDQTTDLIMAESFPRYYTFLFDETNEPFIDHLRLNRGIDPSEINIAGFVTVHDSFYNSTKNNTLEEKAQENIKKLESHDKTLVFAYCEPAFISKSTAFGEDAQKISVPVNILQTTYLKNSFHWKAIKKLDSPRGCLYVYEYSKQLLTNKTKWQAVV